MTPGQLRVGRRVRIVAQWPADRPRTGTIRAIDPLDPRLAYVSLDNSDAVARCCHAAQLQPIEVTDAE